jgi:hypothetical protein
LIIKIVHAFLFKSVTSPARILNSSTNKNKAHTSLQVPYIMLLLVFFNFFPSHENRQFSLPSSSNLCKTGPAPGMHEVFPLNIPLLLFSFRLSSSRSSPRRCFSPWRCLSASSSALWRRLLAAAVAAAVVVAEESPA